MRKVFQADLQQIGEDLIEMSQRVAEAMERAWDSLANADVDLAQEVIAEDAKIDFLQTQLDERAIDTLALQGPVASDLRMIVGSLRMSASLERMGDLARHLAQLARLRFPKRAVPSAISETFSKMAQLDIRIARELGRLLDTRDLAIASQIIELNRELDKLHSSVFQIIAEESWQEDAPTTVDVSLTSRYLERFGDHGVSVARKVTYLVTGEWEPQG
ncbi:phosphate signaling complex protein PhoU [Glutamicibacter creatinolyticus]|uniref:Phosphate-specific transport system accessory protein PhoU n=1 Tax=Glutamicibacter creatinolyticus TaxID=162496 RepID=A0A5B7WT49_9MICC|nr:MULTISPECIES: phosphate signaling complex protein PhoU [Glutamicibacter]QCY46193.1 Phosphate-specific transport system accessory protein PhoU [Glutamicibacter creatinolyticus]TLK53942.1 phosphate signaling complex protein PhoU [Glutamicibacter sp. V16R2B1]